MLIDFNADTKEFHLHNGQISYVITVFANGTAGQLYCGAPLKAGRTYAHLSLPFAGFSNNDKTPARFEYPVYGTGDYRLPALELVLADGSALVEPVYQSHRIYTGKPAMAGLPSVYVEDDSEAETLELDLLDAASGLHITLFYTIFCDYPCVIRHAKLVNAGNKKIIIKNAMSFNLDLPDPEWNLITLTGAWARENHVDDAPLRPGLQGIASSRGISGHQQNPFVIIRRKDTAEFSGEAMGLGLVYSGTFAATAERDPYGMVRLRIGINPETFRWELESGALFESPEAVLMWSGKGINVLSQNFHRLYRTRLARGFWRDRERPVLLNNWEGTYFNFTEQKLLEMAAAAKDLGVELFVLDDGWFGRRDDDRSSLGDWFPHKDKLPNGLPSLVKKINDMGLQFGLWIEPEMVSGESRLFEAHPGWVVGVPGRNHTLARNQMVLDMGRREIVDYLFGVLSDILSSAPITYIKWDMNRCLTEPWSLALPPERQGEFFHRYCLGVYDLYARLTTAFPQVLFESCCSGGGRFDAGMLAFAPQGWTSDNTDALDRLSIQAGASLCYPLSAMGAHVSASPNHQTSRSASIDFRAMVAFFGVFGYELDPTQFSEDEKTAVKNQIAFYKTHRRLFQQGTFIRLAAADGGYAAWMVAGEDCSEAIVGFYVLRACPNVYPIRLALRGLDPAADYEVSFWEEGGVFEMDKLLNAGCRGGDELMSAGLMLKCEYFPKGGDFRSELILLKKI
jgi:alpha-galactosidase